MVYLSEKLKIVGIDSKACIVAIENRFRRLDCILVFNADIRSGLAEVIYNSDKCTLNDVYKAVRDAGYDVHKRSAAFKADRLSLRDAAQLEGELLKMTGILEVNASPATKLIKVTYNPLTTDAQNLLNYLKDIGFKVKLITEIRPAVYKSFYKWLIMSTRILTLAMSIVVIGNALASTLGIIRPIYPIPPSTHLILAVMAAALTGDALVRGIKAIFKLSPTLESLTALSTLIPLMIGALMLTGCIQRPDINADPRVFLDAVIGICGFLSLGMFMEEKLRKRDIEYLEELARRRLGRARVVRGNVILEVDAFKVKPDDIVEVKAGETVAIDGVVIEGWGYVDESSFTSSPLPVIKRNHSRDPVHAGSILVSGSMKVRTTRSGKETLLVQIAETAKDMQFRKPVVHKTIDRACKYITWIALITGLLTALYWWLIRNTPQLAAVFTATVFVAVHPWALGIVTPLVVTLAAYKASRAGILIKRSDAFERVLSTTAVLFDKMGTLTVGKLSVKSLYIANALSEEEVLHYVCSLESKGDHPLALVIAKHCSDRGVKYHNPNRYKHVPCMGTLGLIGDREVVVGSYEMIRKLKIKVNEGTEFLVNYLKNRGSLPLIVAFDRKVTGILEVADTLREDSLKVIKALKKRGLTVGIASGDHRTPVSYYARALELDLAYPELGPYDKAKLIAEMQLKGERVMFIGNGFNDAIALSTAFVGVAMGIGSDVAKGSGDVILAGNDLEGLLRLFKLSEVVKRKLCQNLMLAVIHNTFLMPLATGALYELFGLVVKPLMIYAIMILGLLSVILNTSILLLRHI